MYDYRKDIINLIKHTSNTNESLAQSARALLIIANALLDNSSANLTDIHNEIDTPISVKSTLKRPDKLLLASAHDHTKPTQNALQAKAEPNKDNTPKAKKPMNQKKDPLSIALSSLKQDEYLAVDKLSGTTIKDAQDHDITYFTEKLKRDLGLENGDIVTLNYNASQDKYYLNTIVGHAELTKTINYFKYAKVSRDALGFCVTENINHKQLSNSNKLHSRFSISPSDIAKFNLKEGDFIDLAWYNSQPNNISIIWKYSLNKNETSIPKKHSDYTKKVSVKAIKAQLNFDLSNKTVALVTADDSVTGKFNELIKLHNGKPQITESINGANVIAQLKNADIIVLLQSYLSHDTTKAIIAAYKNLTPIALSETAGQLNLEKAIYRGLNQLGVTDSDNIDYPINK